MRRRLSTMQRLALFLAAKGQCQACGWRLDPGIRWEIDHIVPLALGGDDTDANLQVLCKACHGGKTARQDKPRLAKALRQQLFHLGARKSRFPLFGSKKSELKRRVDGKIVRRYSIDATED
jgi:5-methylcytosine-specific restriction enzyme A